MGPAGNFFFFFFLKKDIYERNKKQKLKCKSYAKGKSDGLLALRIFRCHEEILNEVLPAC